MNRLAATGHIQRLVGLVEAVRATGYRFVTPTPASHTLVNARPQNRQASNLVDVFGWSRPFAESVLPSHLFEALRQENLIRAEGALWRSRVRLSTLGEDLFLHSAFPTEAKDAVFFGPDTYKFADALVACLGRRAAPLRRAVDLCAGAGPGGLTIAKASPEADVVMVDINAEAVRFANANAAAARRSNAVAVHGDLLNVQEGAFDLIAAHPPYLIDRSQRAYRHGGGPLGADLSLTIVKAAIGRLAPAGTLLLFTGVAMVDNSDPFRATVAPWLAEAGLHWTYREVDADVFGEELAHGPYQAADRISLVVLEATRQA